MTRKKSFTPAPRPYQMPARKTLIGKVIPETEEEKNILRISDSRSLVTQIEQEVKRIQVSLECIQERFGVLNRVLFPERMHYSSASEEEDVEEDEDEETEDEVEEQVLEQTQVPDDEAREKKKRKLDE